MRWPFGPPHLTLKPSKKTKQKKTKKNKTKKNTKKTKKRKTKKEKEKNTKIPKKELFSYQSKFSFFWQGIQKLPFFDTLAQKTRTQKHYKNRGFSLFFFGKKLCVTKRPFLDKKNPNSEIPVIIFFLAFFSLSKTKNTKICWNPYFYSVLANLKKENFPKINLKHRNLKNPIFAPVFWKRLFLDNCQIIGHKKKTLNDNCVCKISLETTIFIG